MMMGLMVLLVVTMGNTDGNTGIVMLVTVVDGVWMKMVMTRIVGCLSATRHPEQPACCSPPAGPLPGSGPCGWCRPGCEPNSCAAAPESQPHSLLLVDRPEPAGLWALHPGLIAGSWAGSGTGQCSCPVGPGTALPSAPQPIQLCRRGRHRGDCHQGQWAAHVLPETISASRKRCSGKAFWRRGAATDTD